MTGQRVLEFIRATLVLSLLLLSFPPVGKAATIALSVAPSDSVAVGDEITVHLGVESWDSTDGEVDAVEFNVDFDVDVFTWVAGSFTVTEDGSEFLAGANQGPGYALTDDSLDSLVDAGRFIFSVADLGDTTGGSIGSAGPLGSFRLRATAPGSGRITVVARDPESVFFDPDFSGISPASGVQLGSAVVTVAEVGGSVTYASWAAEIPFSGENDAAPDADPDSDGANNLLEYALGLDPLIPDATELLQIMDEGGQTLTLIYHRPGGAAARSDLEYATEQSGDLILWSDAGVGEETVSEPDANTGLVTVTVQVMPVAGENAAFPRLRVLLVQ